MKRRDLESRLRALGWAFVRHGGSHDVWGRNPDDDPIAVPRHNEINDNLARAILRQAASGGRR